MSEAIFGNWKPFKIDKKCFLFYLKGFFFSRYLKLCLGFLVKQKKSLHREIVLISKFMSSEPRKQAIAIQILSNISRSKGNQALKFGQLIDYNMRNIYLKKSYTKMWQRNYSQTLLYSLHLRQNFGILKTSVKIQFNYLFCFS